jgi:hypothetical protein
LQLFRIKTVTIASITTTQQLHLRMDFPLALSGLPRMMPANDADADASARTCRF